MTVDKICEELLELYQSSKSEFFSEMLALISGRIPDIEHSFFMPADSSWKCLGTTINDDDEVRYLQNLLKTEFKPSDRDYFYFSNMRPGVHSHVVLQLRVRNQNAGIWVMECEDKEKFPMQKEYIRFSRIIALFLQLYNAERAKTRNYYLDSATNLPGRIYFLQTLKKLETCKRPISVCAVRYTRAREMIRMSGYARLEDKTDKLTQRMKELELGNIYSLSEDTFAIITIVQESEIYAALKCFMEDSGMEEDLKCIIIIVVQQMDIIREIESMLSLCQPGALRSQEKELKRPLASIFSQEEPVDVKQQAEEPEPSDSGVDILKLLGSEGL